MSGPILKPSRPVPHLAQYQFKPGNSGGPGRPKGARGKIAEDFIKSLHESFLEMSEQGIPLGLTAIRHVRDHDPTGYLRVIAAILPKELEIKRPLAEMSDDELANAVELIRLAIASDPGGAESGTGSEEIGKQACVIQAVSETD